MTTGPVIYLHIGLPKTGTTFVQQVLARNRETLRDQGLLYPGPGPDHFLPAQDVMGHAFRGHYDERAPGTWARLMTQLHGWQGKSLISHELLSLAGTEQIDRIMHDLSGTEVRVLVTARDLMRQLPAVWQEDLKNGKADTLPAFVERVRQKAESGTDRLKGFWAFQDLPAILARWQKAVPADRIYIVSVPPQGADRNLLWARFAEVLNIELPTNKVQSKTANTSLGAAEAEFLRRLNEQVSDGMDWPVYRQHVKRFLVRRVLAERKSDRPIELNPIDALWACERSQLMKKSIADRGYNVVGTLDDLVSLADSIETVPPAPLPESAVVDVGVGAVGALLRRISQEQRGATAGGAPGSAPDQKRTLLSRIRRRAVDASPAVGGDQRSRT